MRMDINGTVAGIFICTIARDPMREVERVRAIKSVGLEGDRYSTGRGTFAGYRPVSFTNGMFFEGSGFTFADSRRGIITLGVELMRCIGHEFDVGRARFRGLEYCPPCEIPADLVNKEQSFVEAFYDRGGIIAEVIKTGIIKRGSLIIPPPRWY